MAVKKVTAAIILLNVAIFLFMIVFSQLSTRLSDVFPKTQREVSRTYSSEITPAASTFAIWGFIYIYQAVWIVYTISLYWRGDGEILPIWFYLAYSIGNIASVCWLIVWARGKIGPGFGILVSHALSMDIALYFAFTGLEGYLSQFPNNEKLPNRIDVWCVRFLVLNGVMCYQAWLTIATCLNMCLSLEYNLDVSGEKAAAGALAVLLIIVLAWFVVENFFVERYTRFVFIEYIVLIIGLSGILKKHWSGGDGNQSFVLVLLVLAVCLLIARIAIICWKERKLVNNGSYLKYIIRNTYNK